MPVRQEVDVVAGQWVIPRKLKVIHGDIGSRKYYHINLSGDAPDCRSKSRFVC